VVGGGGGVVEPYRKYEHIGKLISILGRKGGKRIGGEQVRRFHGTRNNSQRSEKDGWKRKAQVGGVW